MQKRSKKWKKRVALMGMMATLATISMNNCGKKRDFNTGTITENETLVAYYLEDEAVNKVEEDLVETKKVLEKYNSTLKEQGSSLKLTEDDLSNITRNTNRSLVDGSLANISLKISENEYNEADINCFILETENKEIILLNIYGAQKDVNTKKDLFTNKKITDDTFEYLDLLGECILWNNIKSIGYTTQKSPELSDRDQEFIIDLY